MLFFTFDSRAFFKSFEASFLRELCGKPSPLVSVIVQHCDLSRAALEALRSHHTCLHAGLLAQEPGNNRNHQSILLFFNLDRNTPKPTYSSTNIKKWQQLKQRTTTAKKHQQHTLQQQQGSSFLAKKISPHRFLNFTWFLPPERGHVGWCTPKAELVPGMTKKKGCPLTCSCSCRSTPRRTACTLLRPRRRRIAAGRRGGSGGSQGGRRGGSGSRTGSPPVSHPSLTRTTTRRRRKGPPGPPGPRAAGPARTRRGRPGPGSASDSGFWKRWRLRIRPVSLRSK